jgi:hypothetical protein
METQSQKYYKNWSNKNRTYCSVCGVSIIRYNIHIKSNKHIENEAKNNERLQSREILFNIMLK